MRNNNSRQLVCLTPRLENVSRSVKLPYLCIRPVHVNVPWIAKNGAITLVNWPVVSRQAVQVVIPSLSPSTGLITYAVEQWYEEVIDYRRVHVRGRLNHLEQELWYETKLAYMSSEMYEQTTTWIPEINVEKTDLKTWERIVMGLFGGGFEEVAEANFVYDAARNLQQICVRSGSNLQIKGLGGLLPTLIPSLSAPNTRTA